MDGADREQIAGEVEAESGDSKVLGKAACKSTRLIAKAEGKVARETVGARVMVDEKGGGGVSHAKLNDVLLRVEVGAEGEVMGENDEVVGAETMTGD